MAKYKIIPSSRTIVQSPISIGHKAEKGVEAIEFDVTAWVETYGSGTLTVIMRRWGDAIPYPIALEIDENNKATWTLSDTDTAKAGMAYAQLSYVVGDEVVKKSDIYTFRVMDSLVGEGEPPEAYESWLEHLTHLAAEAMAEVLDIEGIVTDKTLTIDGGIADGKATGDALALKADKSTTYTKTEVDALIESVDVETDTTLSVTGKPADAKKTGDEITALKADLWYSIDNLSYPYINLFNPLYLQTLALWGRNGDEYYGIINNLDKNFKRNDQFYPGLEFEADTQYTLSFDGKMSGSVTTGNGIQFEYHYSDGTVSYFRVPNSQTEYSHYTFTSTAGKTVTMLCISYGGGGANIGYIKQIQLEKGSTATAFQNYIVANDKKARAEIDALSAEIEALSAKHTTDFDNLNNTLNLSAFTKYTKGYIDNSGNIIYPNNWKYTHEWTSDFIKVDPNALYTLFYGASVPQSASSIPEYNIWACYALYDENKNFISRRTYDRITSIDTHTIFRRYFTTTSNASYIRISARHYEDGFMMLYRGNVETPYLFSIFDVQPLITRVKEFDSIEIPDTEIIEKKVAVCLGNNIKSVNHTGWYQAPENTLPAFKLSKKKGFHYVETDVSFTSDGVPVLLHDNTINRTGRNADGTEISGTVNIYDITYEQALEYDFGIYKGQAYAGTKIPTLEQFVILCRNLGLHPYIEIKSSHDYTRQQVEECFNIVKKCGMKDKVTWISFSSTYLAYIKELDPKARIGYVVSTVTELSISTAQELKTATNEVFIDSGSYTDAEVNLCINGDLPMEVWTIGTTALINSMNSYVSGFTSGNLNASQVLYDANIN